MMKKWMMTGLAMLLCLAAVLTGCKKGSNAFGAANNGILLYQDLAVEDVMIDDFDPAKYDLDEYKALLNQELTAYNMKNEFKPGSAELRSEKEPIYSAPLTLTKLEQSGKKIKQQILYANTKDFLKYNEDLLPDRKGSRLSAGTLANVETVVLTAELVNAKGEKLDVEKLCVSKDAANYRYLLCDFAAVLYGEGEIIGYANGSFDKATGSVTAPGGVLTIVIFK